MVIHILYYLVQTLRHKWYVLLEGIRWGVSFWQILIHDWDKFLPSTAYPYARHWIAQDHSAQANQLYEEALNRHLRRNKHHWEYWNQTLYSVQEIPMKYLLEMMADWCAASRTHGNISVYSWYRDHRTKIILAPTTRYWVDHYMMYSPHCKPMTENVP